MQSPTTERVAALAEHMESFGSYTQANEIRALGADRDRLRDLLIRANNEWRHDFVMAVERAADDLFRKLASVRTNPFSRGIEFTEFEAAFGPDDRAGGPSNQE